MKAVFFLILLITLLFCKDEVLLSSGNMHYPPSSWAKGERIVGVASELLEMIFKEKNITVYSLNYGPWKRVQNYTKAGTIDLISTIYKTPAREKDLAYVNVAYMQDKNVIWVHKDKTFHFDTWDDLKTKLAGVVIGDSYGKAFDTYLEKNLKKQAVSQVRLNFKKLANKRIDYIPYGYYTGLIVIKRLGLEEKLVALPKPLLSEGLYFAFSKKSSLKHHIPFLEKRLRELHKNKQLEVLIQKHLNTYLNQQSE